MTEAEYLRLMVDLSDTNTHGGRGIDLKNIHPDSVARFEAAKLNGYVETEPHKGNGVISDLGRQRLAQLLGKPPFPLRYGSQFDQD